MLGLVGVGVLVALVVSAALSVLPLLIGGCERGDRAWLAVLDAEVTALPAPAEAKLVDQAVECEADDNYPYSRREYKGGRSGAEELAAHYERVSRAQGWELVEDLSHRTLPLVEARKTVGGRTLELSVEGSPPHRPRRYDVTVTLSLPEADSRGMSVRPSG